MTTYGEGSKRDVSTYNNKDWVANMTPSSREHMLAGLRSTAERCKPGGREDPYGWIRGAHKEGWDVCRQYKAPDLAKLTEETMGSAFMCASCGHVMFEHLEVEPLKPAGTEWKGQGMQGYNRKARPTADRSAGDATAANPSGPRSAMYGGPNLLPSERRDPDLLGEHNDPLAISARPKPPPPPPPAPPPVPTPVPAAPRQVDENEAFKLEVDRMVHAANDDHEAFKLMVERMVREANAREAAAVAPTPAQDESHVEDEEEELMRKLEAVRKKKAQLALATGAADVS